MLEAFSLPARFERDLLILSNFTHNSMKQEIYLYPFYKKEKKKGPRNGDIKEIKHSHRV